MPAQIDVYRDWLGVTEPERPLTHYQVLRLTKFEDDVVKIRAHYRKMNAHVRKYASGDYAQQSQDLLNELAKVMLCLTDARRKAEYDAGLGRKETAGARRTLEQILIARKIVTADQLAKARTFATTVGMDMQDALIQQKSAAPDAIMQAHAEALGLPYIDLEEMGVREELAVRVPAVVARQHSCVPVLEYDGVVLMASPNPIYPDVEEELRLRLGMAVRSAICLPSRINEAINKYYPRDAAVAQMASGSAKQSVKSTAAAAPAARPAGTSSAASSAAPQGAPLSYQEQQEATKKRRMIAFMAFNFTFMATVAVLYFGFSMHNKTGTIALLGVGALVGALVGGLVYSQVTGRS